MTLHRAVAGSFPANWGHTTHLPKLNALTLAPGNDGLCGSLPTVNYAIKYSSASGLTTNVASNLGACTSAHGPLAPIIRPLLLPAVQDSFCARAKHGRLGKSVHGAGRIKCCDTLLLRAAAACGKLVTTSAEINVYDISVEAGVALRDLLSLNPAIVPDSSLAPGTQLARPCYTSGAPTYFGADLAQVRSCMPPFAVQRKPQVAMLQ